jgi:hypothetical protein
LVFLRPKADTPVSKITKGRVNVRDFDEVYRTEIKMNTLKPHWDRIIVSLEALCGRNPYAPIVMRVMDWDVNPPDDYIGELHTDLHELLDQGGTEEWINLHRVSKKTGVDTYAGCVKIQEATLLKPSELTFEKRQSVAATGQGGTHVFTRVSPVPPKETHMMKMGASIRNGFEDMKKAMEASSREITMRADRLGLGAAGGGAMEGVDFGDDFFLLDTDEREAEGDGGSWEEGEDSLYSYEDALMAGGGYAGRLS